MRKIEQKKILNESCIQVRIAHSTLSEKICLLESNEKQFPKPSHEHTDGSTYIFFQRVLQFLIYLGIQFQRCR